MHSIEKHKETSEHFLAKLPGYETHFCDDLALVHLNVNNIFQTHCLGEMSVTVFNRTVLARYQ